MSDTNDEDFDLELVCFKEFEYEDKSKTVLDVSRETNSAGEFCGFVMSVVEIPSPIDKETKVTISNPVYFETSELFEFAEKLIQASSEQMEIENFVKETTKIPEINVKPKIGVN